LSAKAQEQAVSNYLAYLRDPESVVDHVRVQELADALEQATEPIERLRLRQQLEEAQSADEAPVREAFVVHAQAWASEHGVTASAFQAEGVPSDVLQEAGLLPRSARRRSTRRVTNRVGADDVRKAIPRRKGTTFTIPSLAEKTGASVATARKVVKDELLAGNIVERGSEADHKGRGRPPTLYARA
jgi:hypothetical protein